MQRTVCVLIYFKILFIKYAHKYMVCALKVGIATSVCITAVHENPLTFAQTPRK